MAYVCQAKMVIMTDFSKNRTRMGMLDIPSTPPPRIKVYGGLSWLKVSFIKVWVA